MPFSLFIEKFCYKLFSFKIFMKKKIKLKYIIYSSFSEKLTSLFYKNAHNFLYL